jgi:GNAT superfamily N-acetyltransferase
MRLTPEIVTAMQQLALEQRGLLGARAQWHVGDLAWNLCQHGGPEDEWDIRLWMEEGRLVAWSWLQHDGSLRLEHDVHPDRLRLLDEILANPAARTALAFADDRERRVVLARHGFTQPGEPMHYLVRDVPEPARSAAATDRVPLPDGRPGRRPEAGLDPSGRVGAFPPHRVELRTGARAVAVPRVARLRHRGAGRPFRRLLPVLARRCAPRGRARARRGAAEFRRRGLGAAVCTFALKRLHEEGCRQAIVYCATEPACALYRSLGFRIHTSLVNYCRP